MKFHHIIRINDIVFTSREIDIIACIINVRGAKKIGDILGISPRTVEGYIKNILTKILANSQEGIKDFVERSPQLLLIKQHYINLLINKLFLSQIAKIGIKLKNKDITCIVSDTANEKLTYIVNCLKLANINVIEKSFASFPIDKKITTILTERHLLQLKQEEIPFNVIFICFDKLLNDKFLQRFSYIQVVYCFQDDQIYLTIFKVIELLAPNIDLTDLISNFNEQKNNVINLKIDLKSIDQEVREKKLTRKISLVTVLVSMIAICIILVMMFLIYNKYKNYYSSDNVSVNFLLPNKKILLKRQDIVNQLDFILSKPNEINVGILIGVGGSGKTTIARSYAKNQKASIIWEINAETKNSLFLSLESIAYVLCNNNSDKQELRSILEAKDFINKDKQLLFFTQKQLKSLSNWVVIYDNVESFNDIFEYFPFDSQSWGMGRVIITTRNANIKDNDYIDDSNIIHVGEISKWEKLELFKDIISDSQTQPIQDQKMERFLDNIPSFPLDVSIAAHYLKDTGIEYNKYLEEVVNPKREFTELQRLILQDVNQYTKTRYNIVSLTLQKMMQLNPAFYDLALLIALLDSQDIPEELLVLYKNQYITSEFLRNLKKNSLVTNTGYRDHRQGDLGSLSNFSIHRSTQINILADILGSLDVVQKEKILSSILNSIQSYILKQIDLENSDALKNLIRHCEALLVKQNLLVKKDLISINNSLGIIYYYLGYDKKAKDILEINLDINKYDEETALVLTHLGAIYRKIGQDYKTAINYLEKAVIIYNNISPNNNVREGLALTHLGNTYRTLGDFPNAIGALKKSVKIYHEHPGYYAGEARALGYLGVAYREQNNLVEAKNLLEKAIELYNKEHYPKYSSVYAGTLAHLGITYRVMEMYLQAKDILEESTEIYKQIRPENHPDIGRNILNLGIIYYELQENTRAQELLLKSLNDYEDNYGKDHIETGKVLNHLGRFYILSKNFQKAEDSIKRAINILQKNSHPESYRSFELLGDLYTSALQKSPAINKENIITNYNKSLELALKYFSEDSININRIKNKINNLK